MSARHHLIFFLIWMGGGILYLIFPFSLLKIAVLYLWPIFWFSVSFYYAASAFSFSRRKGVPLFRSLLYGMEALVHYPRFQWVRRPQLVIGDDEKRQILAQSKQITQVNLPSSLLSLFVG